MARSFFIGLTALSAIVLSQAASAQPAAEFYKNRHIDLVVATTPGGGYDVMARIFARHMPRFLPGNPSIVVKNVPGAGGISAANNLYSVAPKDGSVFAAELQGVAFQPLFGEKAARYDATKFTWIGNANSEIGTFFVWHTSPVKTVADLKARDIPAAATDGGSATAFNYRVLNNLLGTKIKIVTGYPGSNESFLALERGEVEGFFSVWSTVRARGNLIKDKQVRVIVQIALDKASDLPDVPLASEFVKDKIDREALDLAVAPGALGRPYIAPPDIPADRAKALRDAFVSSAKDPDFLGEIQKAGLEVSNVMSGEDALALLKRFYSASPEAIAKVSAMTKG
ncbi:MAG TPA: tripartite tricarboxylate transporter substrate-binding protein [Alphaproteobacteria bacterium]|jgi:tripartite-type tricarboxylate transporter receptor subunit TctC|nr:tripartite tricarboxylate transporter substrate-binding protein [Alphaproteobacteria bacterium]